MLRSWIRTSVGSGRSDRHRGERLRSTIGYEYSPTQIGAELDWQTAMVGMWHSCGLRDGGELWCWGSNGLGELGDGEGFFATPMLVPLPAAP